MIGPAGDAERYRSLAWSGCSGPTRRLTRSPAITAIVGLHAHVVQPIRFDHGRAVAFGEGN
jgi:hypothetical protein